MEWQLCESENLTYSVFTGIINQSDNDRRQLRLIHLHNGMQILIVHDAASNMAATNLTVRYGHLDDPDDLPGLSHFLEHMLATGSERYPEEHSWKRHLSGHRGRYAAFTTADITRYSFTAENHGLEGALDRFASFLCQPLFGKETLHQEVRSVESEFQSYRMDDSWRLDGLDTYLSKAESRWKHFGIGNWETLTGTTARDFAGHLEESKPWIDELRRRLCKWFSEHYYASRMHVAIIGADSLEKLTAMAVSHFSPVPDLETSSPASPTFRSPWGAEQEGTVVLAKTISDVRHMEVRWIVPTQTLLYRVKPLKFLEYFLHRRGSGSLQAALTSRGWATSLYASQFTGDREQGFQSFTVMIHLTSTGWRAWEVVLGALHKYIALVDDMITTDPGFAMSIQRELCSLSQVQFRFRDLPDPIDEAEFLGAALSKLYSPADLITGPHLTQDCDIALIADTIALLAHDKARVILSGQDWEGMTVHGHTIEEDAPWDQTPWYNAEHKVFQLVQADSPAYTAADAAAMGLFLRKLISHLPKKFEVLGGRKDGVEPVLRPRKIHESGNSELWYKMDDQFGVPKTSIVVKLFPASAGATVQRSVFAKILHSLINSTLSDDFIDAAFGLLNCELHCSIDGIVVMAYGFSEKPPVAVKNIFDEVMQFVVTPDAMHAAVEKIRRQLENRSLESPDDAAEGRLMYLLEEYRWTAAEMLSHLDSVEPSDVQEYLAGLLKNAYIRVLVNGNTNEEVKSMTKKIEEHLLIDDTQDALGILKSLEEGLRRNPGSASENPSGLNQSPPLPEGCNIVHEALVPNVEELNSGIAFYCQIGTEISAPLRVKLGLWVEMMGLSISEQLRVTEQLGYKVSARQCDYDRTLGFRILIQGTNDPAYFEERIEACLDAIRRQMQGLDDTGFENAKRRYIRRIQRPRRDIQNEAYHFWNQILSGDSDFTRREMDARTAESLTRTDILNFFDGYISPRSPTRSKLSVRFRSEKYNRPVGDTETSTGIWIGDPRALKDSLLSSRQPENTLESNT